MVEARFHDRAGFMIDGSGAASAKEGRHGREPYRNEVVSYPLFLYFSFSFLRAFAAPCAKIVAVVLSSMLLL